MKFIFIKNTNRYIVVKSATVKGFRVKNIIKELLGFDNTQGFYNCLTQTQIPLLRQIRDNDDLINRKLSFRWLK